MAYQRKYATKEALSQALSRAAKSRKNIHNCGRKKKNPDDMQFTAVSMRCDDRDALRKLANKNKCTLRDYIHSFVVPHMQCV